MFKRFSILLLTAIAIFGFSYAKASGNNKGLEISNNYFSFTMPYETKGTYNVSKEDNGIFICEKVSEELEIGGFAFGLQIYKNPGDYADIQGNRKLGELTDKNGKVYDMVLIRPTEIQYADGEKIKENYERLYDAGDNVEIKGINGSKYVKNKGMKGEDLYNDILKKYKKAFTEKWTSDKQYENENMGYAYHTLAKANEDLMNMIGYAYYDINNDGIDELFIGRIDKGKSKGIIYDAYAMINRKPTHVFSGSDYDKNFVCYDDNFLCNESATDPSGNTLYVRILEKNSSELSPQISFIYDESKNKKQPWFIRYGASQNWDNVSKKVFKQRKSAYNDYKQFDYIPFSQLK